MLYLFVAPQDGAFRPPDPYRAIGRLLDSLGSGGGHDELLSLILFQH